MKRIKIEQLLNDPGLLSGFYHDLDRGAIAILPTDTLYGLAVAAHLPAAVERLYQIKQRDRQKPLILFLSDRQDLATLGFNTDTELDAVLASCWPGALTAILPKPDHQCLQAFNFAGIGVRIPAHQQLLQLLAGYAHKLLTTSANRSGTCSDTDPDALMAQFDHQIDWLIDGGILPPSPPSTLVDFTCSPAQVLRPGPVQIFNQLSKKPPP